MRQRPSSNPVAAASQIIYSLPTAYVNVKQLEKDVVALLSSCGTLLPERTVQAVAPDSRLQTLLKLQGTVAVTIAGNTYHIPLKFVFQPTYPRLGPDVFVIPTAAMELASGHPHVQGGTG
eukprot:Filipodium_phascolosomae@DN3447_c0_g1_i1.p1